MSSAKCPKGDELRNKTQIERFGTVTPVWIHQWLWNDAQSLKEYRKGALWFFKFIREIFKVTRDKKLPLLTPIERFRMVTQVWLHRWLWNEAQSLMWYRRGALLFSKVMYQISRSHRIKYRQLRPELNVNFWPVTPVWIQQWIWNDAQSLMSYRRSALLFFKVIHQIPQSHRLKNHQFESNLRLLGR